MGPILYALAPRNKRRKAVPSQAGSKPVSVPVPLANSPASKPVRCSIETKRFPSGTFRTPSKAMC